jgi:hypothetical protein
MLARGQGAVGIGPIRDQKSLDEAIAEGVRQTRGGKVCVIDVHVALEYSRAVSNSLLRQIPAAT